MQWSALVLLALGCTVAQMNNNSDRVLSTPTLGVILAIVMALLSGSAGVYTEMIIKKRPQRSIHVQNFYLYFFGIIFNCMAIVTYDRGTVFEKVCLPHHGALVLAISSLPQTEPPRPLGAWLVSCTHTSRLCHRICPVQWLTLFAWAHIFAPFRDYSVATTGSPAS